jgi:hypothetical protein
MRVIRSEIWELKGGMEQRNVGTELWAKCYSSRGYWGVVCFKSKKETEKRDATYFRK